MTLLVRRRTVVVLVLVTVLAVLVTGIIAYLAVMKTTLLDAREIKILAERVLLTAFVTTTLVIVAIGLVLREVVFINNVLGRLIDMNRAGGTHTEVALNRLGEVGHQIALLQQQISTLSAHKSTRISAMNGLLNAITVRSTQKMLVVNAAGLIYRTTPSVPAMLDKSTAEVTGKHIDTVIESETFTGTVAAIEKSGKVHFFEERKKPVAVVPIQNDQDLVAYYLYYFSDDAESERKRIQERQEAREQGTGEQEPVTPETLKTGRTASTRFRLMQNLFSDRFGKR